MEAFQLRLWDGRIGRWLSTDPYSQYASPYLGMGNNPVSGVDPDGGWLFKFWANFQRNNAIKNGLDPSQIMYSENKGYYFNLTSVRPELSAEGFETGITITSVSSGKGLDNYGWTPQITAHQANFFENIEENYLNPRESDNFIKSNVRGLAKVPYNIVDDIYVYGTRNFYKDNSARHLNGFGASPQEVVESGINTIYLITPSPIKGRFSSAPSLASKFNVATFGSTFKGTFLTKLAPATRGAIMVRINKILTSYTKRSKFIRYSKKGARKVNEEINQE
ncbi:hypothetical protein D3C84_686920 [compost metagenome]